MPYRPYYALIQNAFSMAIIKISSFGPTAYCRIYIWFICRCLFSMPDSSITNSCITLSLSVCMSQSAAFIPLGTVDAAAAAFDTAVIASAVVDAFCCCSDAMRVLVK